MEKRILDNYVNLKSEIDYLERKIASTERRIQAEIDEGLVTDIVSKGKRGKKNIGTVKIEGIPASIDSKKIQLRTLQLKYEVKMQQLLELCNEAEDFIENVEDAQTRLILRYRYEERMSWEQTAAKIGGGNTADSVRKKAERYLRLSENEGK